MGLMKNIFCLAFIMFACQAFSQKEITQQYEKIESYKDGLSWVYYAGMKGLIDEKGVEIIPCTYEAITFYKDNLYWIDYAGMKGLYSLDKKKPVIKTSYDKIEPMDKNQFKVYYAGTEQIIALK
jgi:hypothetical protein